MEHAIEQAIISDKPDTAPKGIPLESILELRNKNLTLEQIGKIVGCTKQTVSQRLKEYQPTFEKIEHLKKNRADVLTLKQSEILNSLTLSEIQKASPQVKGMLFGILYDKERLERGQSSNNISVLANLVHKAHEDK